MVNDAALKIIKNYEGFSGVPYQDFGGVWTIGFGFTGDQIDKNTRLMTEEQAEDILAQKLQFFEAGVRRLVLPATITTNDNQLGAMVSFAYNLGLAALGGSTLLKLHNLGDFKGACGEFLKWNHVGGKIVPGLTSRRMAEAQLYAEPSSILIS